MAAPLAFSAWIAERQQEAEAAVARVLPAEDAIPQRLHAAMRYSVLGGGKRMRPLLVFAAGELVGATPAMLCAAAAAVELIHAYSLVHDDLPSMDNDVLRRGRATCHVRYGEAMALLAGDALQTLAFEVLSAPDAFPDGDRRADAVALLAAASGSAGMAGGQAIDLASVGETLNQPELELMHILKTGALIRAAIFLGVLGGAFDLTVAERAALDRFARRVGLLFQIVDDVLDCTASTEALGKTAGKDEAGDKPTYVRLLGLEGARARAGELRQEALAALEGFGARADSLRALTEFILRREY
ncbi:MAG: polyprenyl synthetase family protein [Zoogloeaceae bacterium]|jgi:farnesyl diphosphate synthase|nr:polyprenyl synthetase family protein [Zoogloeaceae bacterium]